MSIRNSDQEVIEVANQWLQANHTLHLVTVVRTWGSSPRPVGSIAAVRDDGELVGSVSGGCVEKKLVESLVRAKQSSDSDAQTNPLQDVVSTLHVNDEQARRYGLACGGELELVFESFTDPSELTTLAKANTSRECIRRTVDLTSGEISLEPLMNSNDDLPTQERFHYDGKSVSKIFGPSWRILIIGAGQLSRYTAEFALALDYDVMVCDPRPGFKDAWQVSGVPVLDMSPDDAVTQYATDAHSAVLALTHDTNADDLALLEALPSNAFYVGALGSKRNYEKRKQRLAGLGLEPHEIDRLIGPVGLDIGSRSSAEIAISIMAHIIEVRNRANSSS